MHSDFPVPAPIHPHGDGGGHRGWPSSAIAAGAHPPEFVVTVGLELDEVPTITLTKHVMWGDVCVADKTVWSRAFANRDDASVRYEWLANQPGQVAYWAFHAELFGGEPLARLVEDGTEPGFGRPLKKPIHLLDRHGLQPQRHPTAGLPTFRRPTSDHHDAVPLKVVARSFTGRALPLGLDHPLELRGGGSLAPEALALELPLHWAPDMMAHVAAACRRQSVEGRHWFTMPPAALSGVSGLGRTHIARTIARHAGVPFASFDVGGSQGADRMTSWSRTLDIAVPPSVVLAMATSGCANPLILVTGVDDATPATAEALAAMIARESAPRWVAEGIEAVVDLGQVSWLIQTSDSADLPPSFPVDLQVIGLTKPDQGRAALLGLSLLNEVAADLQLPVGGLMPIVDHIVDFVRFYGGTPVSGLYSAIMESVVEFETNRT